MGDCSQQWYSCAPNITVKFCSPEGIFNRICSEVGLTDFSSNKTPIKTCFWTNSVWNAFWLLQTWTLDSCTQHICTLHMQCTCSIGTWRDSRKPRCLPTIYHFFASQLIDYQRETGRSCLQISLTIFPTPPFDLLPVKLAGSDSLPKILFPDSEK